MMNNMNENGFIVAVEECSQDEEGIEDVEGIVMGEGMAVTEEGMAVIVWGFEWSEDIVMVEESFQFLLSENLLLQSLEQSRQDA